MNEFKSKNYIANAKDYDDTVRYTLKKAVVVVVIVVVVVLVEYTLVDHFELQGSAISA